MAESQKAVPAVVQLMDFLGEKVPGFLVKHPALTAAGVGIGIGANNMRGPAYALENSLMAENLGVPGSKYACNELKEFAERKDYVSTKLAFEKVGDDSGHGYMGGFLSGAGKETARTGIGVIRQAIDEGGERSGIVGDGNLVRHISRVVQAGCGIQVFTREKRQFLPG